MTEQYATMLFGLMNATSARWRSVEEEGSSPSGLPYRGGTAFSKVGPNSRAINLETCQLCLNERPLGALKRTMACWKRTNLEEHSLLVLRTVLWSPTSSRGSLTNCRFPAMHVRKSMNQSQAEARLDPDTPDRQHFGNGKTNWSFHHQDRRNAVRGKQGEYAQGGDDPLPLACAASISSTRSVGVAVSLQTVGRQGRRS